MTETLCTNPCFPHGIWQYALAARTICSECRTLTVLFRAHCYILRSRCVHLRKKNNTTRNMSRTTVPIFSVFVRNKVKATAQSPTSDPWQRGDLTPQRKQGKSAPHAHTCNYLTCPEFGAALCTTTEAVASAAVVATLEYYSLRSSLWWWRCKWLYPLPSGRPSGDHVQAHCCRCFRQRRNLRRRSQPPQQPALHVS